MTEHHWLHHTYLSKMAGNRTHEGWARPRHGEGSASIAFTTAFGTISLTFDPEALLIRLYFGHVESSFLGICALSKRLAGNKIEATALGRPLVNTIVKINYITKFLNSVEGLFSD